MHFYKPTSVLIILVLWCFMIACPAARVLHPKPNAVSAQIDHADSAESSINHQQFFHTSTTIQTDSLDKRGEDSNLALMVFEPNQLLFPVQAAAEVLEAFYAGVARNSHGAWARNTPRIWLRMGFGALRLVMTSTEGTTIPWDFVTKFALNMLRLAERGYTGTYDANFVDPVVGNSIWVSLVYCGLVGPLTDLSSVGTTAKGASCLNPSAPAWFPGKGTPKG